MLSLIVLSLLLRQLPPSLELPAKDVDSILTFSQTVGAPAFASASTQPHLLNQAEGMYGHAAAARPRMARSLEEAGRRHGVLSNMHEKLGEAVRIYERLLDRRLNEGAEPSYPYQQPNQYNHSPYPQHPQYHPQQQQQQHYSQYSQPPPTSAPQAQSPPPAEPSNPYPNLYPSLQSGHPSQQIYHQQHHQHEISRAPSAQSPSTYNAPSAPFSSNQQHYEYAPQQYQHPNQHAQYGPPPPVQQSYQDPTPSTPSSARIPIHGVAPPSAPSSVHDYSSSQAPIPTQETGTSSNFASAPSQAQAQNDPNQQGSAPTLPQFEKLMSPSASEQALNSSPAPPEDPHSITTTPQAYPSAQPHAGVGAHGSRGMTLGLNNGTYQSGTSSPQASYAPPPHSYSQPQSQTQTPNVSSPAQYSFTNLPSAPTHLPQQQTGSSNQEYSAANGWNQVPITNNSSPSTHWNKQVDSPLIDL